MENEVTKWNKVMFSIMNIPGIKIDRIEFLVEALRPYCTDDEIKKACLQRPIDVLSAARIDAIANEYIAKQTKKVTAVSALTGIPGGPAVFLAIPVDLIQYYYHTLIVAQKLAYLYGYPDLRQPDGTLKASAYDLLTIFLGVMLGSDVANRAIKDISKDIAQEGTPHLPQIEVSKTIWYPFVRSVSKWIRVKVARGSLTKRLSKAIPVLGGVIAGTLTYMAFKPNAKNLQKAMAEDVLMFKTDAGASS